MKLEDIKVGQVVEYTAGGKVSRLEGKAGQRVRGVVDFVSKHTDELHIHVMPIHRTLPGAMFKDLGASLTMENDIKIVED